jgi:hypothetical protein
VRPCGAQSVDSASPRALNGGAPRRNPVDRGKRGNKPHLSRGNRRALRDRGIVLQEPPIDNWGIRGARWTWGSRSNPTSLTIPY